MAELRRTFGFAVKTIGLTNRPSPAVRDRRVITANGLVPFAFAAEIFWELAPDREEDIAMYEQLWARGVLD